MIELRPEESADEETDQVKYTQVVQKVWLWRRSQTQCSFENWVWILWWWKLNMFKMLMSNLLSVLERYSGEEHLSVKRWNKKPTSVQIYRWVQNYKIHVVSKEKQKLQNTKKIKIKKQRLCYNVNLKCLNVKIATRWSILYVWTIQNSILKKV